MCVEARILTCGHEYHTGSLIISFCYIIACEGFSQLRVWLSPFNVR